MYNKKHLEYLLHKRAIFNRWARMGGRANLSGADLARANLAWADLSGATLRQADLDGATLRGATLRGADLSNSTLVAAYLRGADLNGSTLIGADLRQANLAQADLPNGVAEIFLDPYRMNVNADYTCVGCVRRPTSWWLDATEDDVASFADDAREWWREYGGMVKRICARDAARWRNR